MAIKFDSIEGSGYPTALAAFSAGVSLCSTSLGSNFIILASANLQKTPIGTLIAGAAMLDDILVLVMVKIITALGQGQSDSWTIARPAIASLGLILATFLLTPFLLKLLLRGSHSIFTYPKVGQETFDEDIDTEKGISRHTGFILSTLMLIVLVTIAACVEGSILLSAFLAGAVVRHTWQTVGGGEDIDLGVDRPTMMFEEYYKPIMDHILVPFFFASIGFSIPVSEMFSGSILWKGIFYGCLMFLAKASVGVVVYFEFFATKWSHNWTDCKKITLPIVEELPQQDGSPEEVPTNDIVNQKLKKGPPPSRCNYCRVHNDCSRRLWLPGSFRSAKLRHLRSFQNANQDPKYARSLAQDYLEIQNTKCSRRPNILGDNLGVSSMYDRWAGCFGGCSEKKTG